MHVIQSRVQVLDFLAQVQAGAQKSWGEDLDSRTTWDRESGRGVKAVGVMEYYRAGLKQPVTAFKTMHVLGALSQGSSTLDRPRTAHACSAW